MVGRPNVGHGGPHDDLVQKCMPHIEEIAGYLRRRFPAGIDTASLVQSGCVAVLDSARRYDPERSISFIDFAKARIYGEMVEHLRSLDFASRQVRNWGRKITQMRIRLLSLYGEDPTSEGMSEALGVSLDYYHDITWRISTATVLYIEDIKFIDNGLRDEGYAPQREWASPDHDPFLQTEKKDLIAKVNTAIEDLSEQEQMILKLYYDDGMTLLEISKVLGRTEGRICQVLSSATKKLRAKLNDRQ